MTPEATHAQLAPQVAAHPPSRSWGPSCCGQRSADAENRGQTPQLRTMVIDLQI